MNRSLIKFNTLIMSTKWPNELISIMVISSVLTYPTVFGLLVNKLDFTFQLMRLFGSLPLFLSFHSTWCLSGYQRVVSYSSGILCIWPIRKLFGLLPACLTTLSGSNWFVWKNTGVFWTAFINKDIRVKTSHFFYIQNTLPMYN